MIHLFVLPCCLFSGGFYFCKMKNKNGFQTVQSKITFLRMEKQPSLSPDTKNDCSIIEFPKPIGYKKYISMYKQVGEHLNWLDRLLMDNSELYKKINDNSTHIYQFFIQAEFAGYCELVQEKDFIEILYFGLTPAYTGKGYGKYFLNRTIEKAWSFNPRWIQLNTCDLDHPNALNTYLKAGFKIYKTFIESKYIHIPTT